jgi:hypothetical protein
MYYLLLQEVLPYDVVEIIYEFMKVNAVNVIINYLNNAKKRHSVYVYFAKYKVEYISAFSIYSINSIVNNNLGKDEIIETIYKNLVWMYGAHYSRTYYSRNGWRYVLNNISQILMYYYNRLAFSDGLKKNNVNYNYLKMCIQQWFKLCQKYNFYLLLSYIDSVKKVNRNIKAIQLRTRTIKNFAEFRVSPLVTMRFDDYKSLWFNSNYISHHRLLGLNPQERRNY